MSRRFVSDVELSAAYTNPENQKVIKNLIRKFEKRLDHDELESCAMLGLWKALGYHTEGKGMAWASNLFKFVRYEILRSLKREKRQHPDNVVSLHQLTENVVSALNEEGMSKTCGERSVADFDDLNTVLERLRFLSPTQRKMLQEHYFDGFTLEETGVLNGVGKEVARARLAKALERLREVCPGALPNKLTVGFPAFERAA